MKAGLRVREVQRATPTLEQVFMSLLEQDDLQPAATASPARAEAAA
jgi:hypothetical protein